jgi:general secretion pathway protein I
MAILALSLMAIFDLNAGAVSMHTYTKKVTVASLLARSKLTDLEQDLFDKGFPADDEERSGDFSDEGWSGFKWRAKIIAPKTQGVSTEQLIGAVFGLPTGDSGDAISAMFGGGAGSKEGGPQQGASPMAGAMAGMAQAQMTQFLDQIRNTVREVHLTVSWKDGKQVESVDLVTHIIAGTERNGAGVPGGAQASGAPPNEGQGIPGQNGLQPGAGATNPFSPNFRPPGGGTPFGGARGLQQQFPQQAFPNGIKTGQ